MALLGRAAVAIFSDMRDAQAHDHWHSHEHMPERIGIPGFLRARRCVALEGESAPTFVLYDDIRRLPRAPEPPERVDPTHDERSDLAQPHAVRRGCHLVLLNRMDNTSLATVTVAQDKSTAACGFRLDTKGAMERLNKGPEGLFLLALRGMTPVEGGVPIVVDGKLVGAIGISGGSSAQDDQIAKAGAAALAK